MKKHFKIYLAVLLLTLLTVGPAKSFFIVPVFYGPSYEQHLLYTAMLLSLSGGGPRMVWAPTLGMLAGISLSSALLWQGPRWVASVPYTYPTPPVLSPSAHPM